jgi:quinohemoprotein amine dehydrogenase
MNFRAAMMWGLGLTLAALSLSGCGSGKSSDAKVKTLPRMTEAETGRGHQLIVDNCGSCHEEGQGGRFSRISYVRKTPEGWDMTIARMINFHGVGILPDDRREIVAYLANRQGLAPAEVRDFRYALERRPNVMEAGHDDDLMHMCARCHTYARFALQRRDRDEWVKLAHMHLGQWPSAEYQMLARERDWWADATGEVADKLAKAYPFQAPAWEAWKGLGRPVLDGSWRVTGHQPGRGDYEGMAKITASPAGGEQVSYDLTYQDGWQFRGTTRAALHTGYEWRGEGSLDGENIQEVYAVAENGLKISGRWFLENADEIGGDLEARRVDAAPAIMAVTPAYAKVGQQVSVTLSGVGLDGSVDLGAGINVSPVSSSAGKIVVTATVTANAKPGLRTVRVGDVSGPSFAVYNKLDHLRVTPGNAVARMGGGGGFIAPVAAQFEAVGYLNGPDGKPGTADDIRVGVFPALWTVEPYDATAAEARDEVFAGQISPEGRFIPAPAGPNPKRKFGGSNAGNLNVAASVKDGAQALTGKAHLIVSPQRWNTPPIR